MPQGQLPFYQTITFQLTAALLALLVLFAATLAYNLFLAEERERDHVVINTAARLDLVAGMMHHQARNYLAVPARDYSTYDRDVQLYYRDLRTQLETFDQALGCFTSGRFEMTNAPAGKHKVYTFDSSGHPSVFQLRDVWKNFRRGLGEALGPQTEEPRLEYAAEYIDEHADKIAQAAATLNQEFQRAASERLARNRQLNRWTIAIALSFLILTVAWAQRSLRPLKATMQGFRRVESGDFGYKVPTISENEIGVMAQAFNGLTDRLQGIFRLVDQTHQGKDIGSGLGAVAEALRRFLPIDWAGVLLLNPDGSALVLEHAYANGKEQGVSRRYFPRRDSPLEQAMKSGRPLRIPDVQMIADVGDAVPFYRELVALGLRTALVLPIQAEHQCPGVLVFATRRPHAYLLEHEELIRNLASLVSHGFHKTVALENLVVSAVAGLAKLAESRDPETGEHLRRMSLYSSILAERLAEQGPYRGVVTPRFVRDVYRFAPMHDIGKVGVRDQILLKGGDFTDEERAEMRQHPLIGGSVLRQCEDQMQHIGYSVFTTGIEIAEGHHEKFDGSGYPRGLAGQEIPLAARIVAVTDVFDALTSKRPYKPAWSVEAAITYLREQRGRHFDPAIVDAFESAMSKVRNIYQRHRHI